MSATTCRAFLPEKAAPHAKIIPLHRIELDRPTAEVFKQDGSRLEDRLVVVFTARRHNTTFAMSLRDARTHWDLVYKGTANPDITIPFSERSVLDKNRYAISQAIIDMGFCLRSNYGQDFLAFEKSRKDIQSPVNSILDLLPERPDRLPACQGTGGSVSFACNFN